MNGVVCDSMPRTREATRFIAPGGNGGISAWPPDDSIGEFQALVTGAPDQVFPVSACSLWGTDFIPTVAKRTTAMNCVPSLLITFIIDVALLSTAVLLPAQESVLHRFGSGSDGIGPKTGVIADKSGNLYGTTFNGGGGGSEGTVFMLTHPQPSDNLWKETILHRFNNLAEGQYPWTGLVQDPAGNLFGTTWLSAGNHCANEVCGVIFELSPPSSGSKQWTYRVIYEFTGNADGGGPWQGADLVRDSEGNLFGTTASGGSGQCIGGCGVVFELSPVDGTWTETVLYNFPADASGNGGGNGGVILDQSGNLYGTTYYGGSFNPWSGVFKLVRPSKPGGTWKYVTIHNLISNDEGTSPAAGLVFDSQGNLYGTTEFGGTSSDFGTVFRLTPQPSGSWIHSVLHKFTGMGDGQWPTNALTVDAEGNVYGTTQAGGVGACHGPFGLGCSVAFRFNPPADAHDPWIETVFYTFAPGTDGDIPWGRLIFGAGGQLYGATQFGGILCDTLRQGCGTVFALAPNPSPIADEATALNRFR